MKSIKVFAAVAALATLFVSCGSSKVEGSKETQALLPTSQQVDSASYLMGVNFGIWLKAQKIQGDINWNQLVAGLKTAANAKGEINLEDEEFTSQFKVSPALLNEVLGQYFEKQRAYLSALNTEKQTAFLAENLEKEGVQVTESGLQYKIIEPGNDVKPGAKDTVWVNYVGKHLDGTVFDQSPEGETRNFTCNRVIKGWGEGLGLVGEGGKIELYIPYDLAYGEYGSRGGIDPCECLIFEVELTKVGKVTE